MPPARSLIINADDLGISAEVNEGVFIAYDAGVITDASLLVKGAYAPQAIREIKRRGSFHVGIHLDLDHLLGWRSPGIEAYSREELNRLMDTADFRKKLHKEINSQIVAFLDTGLIPSHIDTHHHCHGFPQVFVALIEAMDGYGIKAIRFSRDGYHLLGRENIQLSPECAAWMEGKMKKRGIAYPDRLIDPLFPFSLLELPPGVSELMVHPSKGGDQWRQRDLEMLVDPSFAETLVKEDIRLISFVDLMGEMAHG